MKLSGIAWRETSAFAAGRRRSAGRSLCFESLEPRQMLHASGEVLAPVVAEGEGEAMPDFVLIDVNPTSATYNQDVSPRDYLGQVSGWYFTYST